MELSRKDFIKLLVIFGAGGAAACGQPSPAGADCAKNGGHATEISNNHGHELMVPAADFSANADKTYSIMGQATHDHTLTLTAAQLSQIAQGTMVTAQSSTTAGHLHNVTVGCA